MQIDIKDNDKIRVGIAIDFQRKETFKRTGNANYKIINFIDGCCSRQTFNQMVKGKPLKESEVYDELLKKLNSKYNYNDDFVKKFLLYEIKLINCLKKDDMDTFFSNLNKALKILNNQKGFILEDILYQNLSIIAKYSTNEQITNVEFESLLNSYDVLTEMEKEITANFILHYFYHHETIVRSFQYLKKRINIYGLKEKYNKVRILDIMIRFQQYYDASCFCEEILSKYVNEKDITYFSCLISRLYIINEIQPESFDFYKKELSTYSFIKNGIKTKYYYDYYHILGLHSFYNNDLVNAFSYFIIAIEDERNIFPEIIYLYSIEGELNRPIPNEIIQKCYSLEANGKFDNVWMILYDYYKMKRNKENPSLLEEYIMKNFKVVINDFYPKHLIVELLMKELKQLAALSGNNKNIYHFNRYIKRTQ